MGTCSTIALKAVQAPSQDFRDYLERSLRDPFTVNRDAFALANRWHSRICEALVDPNKTKGIPPAINALCRRIYLWLQDN